jgi:hypothetical protein
MNYNLKLRKDAIYICVSNAKEGGLFSWLQRFVTGGEATHSEPLVHSKFFNSVVGLSADKVCTIEFLADLTKNPSIDVWVFEIPINCDCIEGIDETFTRENLHKNYGFLQILYFLPRRLAELVGIDIRRWWNPFPSGRICSEICYRYWKRYINYLPKEFIAELNEWKKDNIHSTDILNLCLKHFQIKRL